MEMFMRVLENPGILQAILESLHSGVYFVGRDQKILFWNEGAERITGYLSQDVVGHHCCDLFPAPSEDQPGVCPIGGALAAVLRDGRPSYSDVAIPSPRRTSGLPAGVGHSDSWRRRRNRRRLRKF